MKQKTIAIIFGGIIFFIGIISLLLSMKLNDERKDIDQPCIDKLGNTFKDEVCYGKESPSASMGILALVGAISTIGGFCLALGAARGDWED